METKLVLELNEGVVEKAKIYANDKKVSLSVLVEEYLQTLTLESASSDFEISPFIKSISTGKSLPNDLDYKKEYSNFLIEKYK